MFNHILPVKPSLNFVTALALAVSPLFLAAEEEISTESSIDSNGMYQILLEGTNFPPAPNLAVFDNFEKYSNNNTITLNEAPYGSWDSYGETIGKPKSQSYLRKKTSGDTSKRYQSSGQEIRDFNYTDGNKIAKLQTVFPRTSQVYLSYSVLVPEGNFFSGASSDNTFPSVSSWKFTWILDGAGAYQDAARYDLCVPTHVGNGNFLIAGNVGNLDTVPGSFQWSWHSQNYFSFGMKADSTDPINNPGYYFFKHTADKSNQTTIENSSKSPMFSGVSTGFDRIMFPGWWGNGDTSNFNAVYDDIYVAYGENAFSRIELLNSNDPETATSRVNLPFDSWNSTSISAKIPKEFLSTTSNKYLFIYDQNNNIHTGPLRIICKSCPSIL